jgi:glutathione peroxidase
MSATSLYDFSAASIKGAGADFGAQRGKVFLIVNTASACGFTPQFAGLEQLWKDYGPRGLVVVGFPCNQFGHQDPGANSEIESFCQLNYGVSFPMMSKVDVNGDKADPLWKWNFTKFLVGKDGHVIKRYPPTAKPEKLRADIEAALGA